MSTSASLSAVEIKRRRAGHWLEAPALITIAVSILIPLCVALGLSLTKYDLINPPEFVGLQNYVDLLIDPIFHKVVFNTFYFAGGQVIVGIVVVFFIALLFATKIHGGAAMRTIVYLPQAMSYVTVALVWSFLYDPFIGPINKLIQAAGAPQINFLTDTDLAMPSIMVMSLWRNLGYFMIIMLAGIQAVPTELKEAALIDGAGSVHRLIHVILPQMKNTIFFVAITWFLGGLQMFAQAYVMTSGGPEYATRSIVYEMYERAFNNLDIGHACAVVTLLLLFVMSIGIPVRIAQERAARKEKARIAKLQEGKDE